MKQSPELHLIVLWEHARVCEREIIDDISKNLQLVDVYEIKWSDDKVSENFTRFYGTFLPSGSQKETHCGCGAFLCLVVRDDKPKYEMVETSRGHEYVNINIFNLKQKYREWTGGGHKVHTTNSIDEVTHDAVLLLGLNYADLVKSAPKKWNGKIKKLNRDLTGANGWDNLTQLFYTLNATTNYVVLRNAEILPAKFDTELHGDIDILTDDFTAISFIINAKKVFPEPYRVHCETKVANKRVLFDFRYIGDNYYCTEYERCLLQGRVLTPKGIFVLKDKDLFYSLIYHALMHKERIASDYYDKIYKLFVKLGLNKKYNIKKYTSPFDLYFQLLVDFMHRNKYAFVKPKDYSVYYSEKLTKFTEYKKYLESKFGFSDVQTVHTDKINRAYNIFASGYDANGTRMFIKISDISGIYANEYHMGKSLYDKDDKHFIRPMYYRDCPDGHFVAYKWTDGITLQDLLDKSDLSDKERKQCLDDVHEIFKCLQNSDVVHRDITLKNFIWAQGRLKLIDFQLAVSKSHYHELNFLSKNPYLLQGLGTPEFRRTKYQWDDAYSLCRVIECIGRQSSYGKKYDEIYNEIHSCINKTVIKAPNNLSKLKSFEIPGVRIKHSPTSYKFSLFGAQIMKTTKSTTTKKYYLFGVPVFKRKI